MGIRDFLKGIGAKKPKRRRRERRRPTRKAGSSFIDCTHCQTRVKKTLPRCPNCGTRVVLPTSAAEDAQAGKAYEGNGLDAYQKKLLLATHASTDRQIYVLPSSGSQEGEVKAGSLRIYGDEALRAVSRLDKEGFVNRIDDHTFELTEEGCLTATLVRTREG